MRIDSTLAGLAFRRVEMQQTDEAGRARLWVPLTDGTNRVGVLGMVLDREAAADGVVQARVRGLAALVAEWSVPVLVDTGSSRDLADVPIP